MGWIAVGFIFAALAGVGLVASRNFAARRSERLETAFFRARGHRLTTMDNRSIR